jgi:hypothetical protein
MYAQASESSQSLGQIPGMNLCDISKLGSSLVASLARYPNQQQNNKWPRKSIRNHRTIHLGDGRPWKKLWWLVSNIVNSRIGLG